MLCWWNVGVSLCVSVVFVLVVGVLRKEDCVAIFSLMVVMEVSVGGGCLEGVECGAEGRGGMGCRFGIVEFLGEVVCVLGNFGEGWVVGVVMVYLKVWE